LGHELAVAAAQRPYTVRRSGAIGIDTVVQGKGQLAARSGSPHWLLPGLPAPRVPRRSPG